MGASEEERERRKTRVKAARERLGLTEEGAARLLRVSKTTWVRWESGEFWAPELSLKLLPYLARAECPPPCSFLTKKFDGAKMAAHIPTCTKCQLMINYLAVIAKQSSLRK